MEDEEKKDEVGEREQPPMKPRQSLAARRASMSARKASFFIGDVEGHKIPVKIVGPDDQEIPSDEIVVPPDGGYGYIIVLAAFFSNVIVDGIVFSFGSLKDSIQNDENIKEGEEISASTIAWVGSLLTGFYLLTGPFVSAIASKFGFRTVAILGSLIACGGFTIAWFLNPEGKPPNIPILITFYGCIGGIGFSCIYVPAVIAVGFYFEKKRALATGIAICGSGIGNFLFPPLIAELIRVYKWQGTVLTLGFIVLLCGGLGILYRPLTPKKVGQKRVSIISPGGTPEGTPLLMRIKRARDMMKWDSVNSFISNRGDDMTDGKGDGDDPQTKSQKLYNQARKYSTVSLKGQSNPISIPGAGGMQPKRGSVPTMLTTAGDAPSFPQATGVLVNVPSKAPSLKAKSFVGLPDLHEIEEEHGSDEAGSRENSVGPQHKLAESESKAGKMGNASSVTCRIGNSMLTVDEMTNSRIIRVASRVTLNKPLYRDDIFYSGSLWRIPDYSNNVMTSTEWTAAVTRGPDLEEEAAPRKSCFGSCDIVKKMLDVSLLVSPTFIVFSISGMFSMLGMFVPFVYLIDQAYFKLNELRPKGAEEIQKMNLTVLLSLIGVANTVGRILAGWIADRPFINALVLNNCAVTIMGISTAVVPLLTTFPGFMFYSCVFGISMACFASLRSILVVELMGLSKLTNAFGLLLLFQGIASMVATPLAGGLSMDKNFSVPFYAAGGFLTLSAVMCYPLNKLNRWEKNRKKLRSISKDRRVSRVT